MNILFVCIFYLYFQTTQNIAIIQKALSVFQLFDNMPMSINCGLIEQNSVKYVLINRIKSQFNAQYSPLKHSYELKSGIKFKLSISHSFNYIDSFIHS